MAKKKMGRPSKYAKTIVLKILEMASRGCAEQTICAKMKINVDTLHEWKKVHPDFSEALKAAKEISDDEVVETLRSKALGYTRKSVKFWYDADLKQVVKEVYDEYYPPDTTALIFWLKNRQPDRWRERKEITGKDGEALNSPQIIVTLPDNGKAAK